MIVLSEIVEASTQADGREWVHERHTDQLGQVYETSYLRELGVDRFAVLTARATAINAILTQGEINANVAQVIALGSLAVLTTNFSTLLAALPTLRAAYKVATGPQAVMIADYLNTLTNAQLANAFGITTTAAATLRANKLAPAVAPAAAYRDSSGA